MSTEMSPTDQAELERLMGFDSSQMPTSMAVNQETLRMDASSENTEARSLYYGVYNVKPESQNFGKFKFRAAIRLGNDKFHADGTVKSKATWVNLGYFNCEHTAGMAFNVAAVNYFGKGAWLNPIDTANADPEEYAEWKEQRAEYIVKASAAVAAIVEKGGSMRYVDLEANRQSAHTNGKS